MAIDVVVNPLTAEGIIGLEFLREQRTTIDLDANQVKFAEYNCTLPLYQPPGEGRERPRNSHNQQHNSTTDSKQQKHLLAN